MSRTLILAIVLALMTGCASTELVSQWTDTAYTGPTFHNILVVGMTGPMIRWLPWMRWLSLEMRRLLGPIDRWTVGVVALASGIGEEVFFRGALLPVTGLVVSSLIFAGVHTGPDRRYLSWTAFSFAVGVGLGWIVVVTGSLLGAIVAHVVINAVNLRRIGRLRDRPSHPAAPL